MKEFLDNFAAVLGAATLALLLFAVCHEYGYFWIIGSQFQPFVSTSDYFTNATQWFLAAALSFWAWLDWKSITGAVPYMAPLSRDRRTWIFPAIVFFVFFLDRFFSSQPTIQLFFVFTYGWLVYGAKYALKWANLTDAPSNFRSALTALPVLAMLAFVVGQQKAVFALLQIYDPYALKLKGGEIRQRILLRNFDKGLLVRSPADQRVEFIRWDQIEEVTKTSPKYASESYACIWLSIGCHMPRFTP